MKLLPEDRLILSSIKINPTKTELAQIDNLILEIQNWDYLTQNIIDKGMAPLLYKKLPLLANRSIIPGITQAKLQQTYYTTIRRGALLLDHFRHVADAFSKADIAVIVLKGAYLAENLYHDIGLRQFSDIDLLVHKEDGEKCLAILESLGYVEVIEAKHSKVVELHGDIVHYPPMVLNGVSIEIHTKLHRTGEKYNLLVNECWKDALPATINGFNALAFCVNDLLIYLCVHLDKHIYLGKFQFTCLSDITNVLTENKDNFDWDIFIKHCCKYQAQNTVMTYIVLVNKYMNAPVPIEIVEKYKHLLTPEIEDLFIKHTKGIDYKTKQTLSIHFYDIKNVETLPDKLRYIKGALFPPKDFMIERYKIKKPSLFLFYYPYRYYLALKGIVFHLKKKFKERKSQ